MSAALGEALEASTIWFGTWLNPRRSGCNHVTNQCTFVDIPET
jgi:hypothetical protein